MRKIGTMEGEVVLLKFWVWT